MEKLATYKNGNTYTTIYEDGTKVHFTKDDDFIFDFPEAHDIQISQCCDNGCEFCYAGCSVNGKHGKLTNWKFFETMRPYTEIAINLQFPLPLDLMDFLEEMKKRQIIVNVTINQKHFMSEHGQQLIQFLIKTGLIKGVGISLVDPTQEGFIETVKRTPNAIVHVIAGVICPEDIGVLGNQGLKILILGYKTKGRGLNYYKIHNQGVLDNIAWLESCLMDFVEEFNVISFDNLALEQLHVKDKLSEEDWEKFYAGEDGSVTFYIDLVNGTFARSSISETTYPIGDKSVDEMFAIIKEEVNGTHK